MTALVIVVAVADNGVVGRDNRLPWHIPGDLKRFKALTMGRPMLMGRRTWDSIGRPLPGRRSLVLSRDPAWAAEGAGRVGSIDEALTLAGDAPELMVIGGAELIRLAMARAGRIELTRVHATPDGDVRWHPPEDWSETMVARTAADRDVPAYDFVTLVRPSVS